MNYDEFLDNKTHCSDASGFDPLWMPEFLYDFQRHLVEWAIRKGRCAIFADCGMGKTPMQLVWADNVARKTGKPVLIVTPLAVSHQTVREAHKFDIEAARSADGTHRNERIVVTNYERLGRFTFSDFAGVVCDESSILKNFDGATKSVVTEFARRLPYRLLCTATAAPNDYVEFGTSSEALGYLGHMDMLGAFFKQLEGGSLHLTGAQKRAGGNRLGYTGNRFVFKPHAERPFWRWVCSWARAIRKPSDLGFDDGPFVLPPLDVRQTIVEASRPMNGFLFVVPAHGLKEQRDERRHTIAERCEAVAELVNGHDAAVVWCHLNSEGDLLERLIPDAIQISGTDSDDSKESKFAAFSEGRERVLVIKPKIGAFGLNWQHCSHMTFFPSHSFEQYYQGVRRCWRFGQTRPVRVDIVSTEGEASVTDNLQRKADQADAMFASIVSHMNEELARSSKRTFTLQEELPQWL